LDDGGVGRAVFLDADEGLNDAAALDLVVVLADDPLFAADVGAGKNAGEDGVEVL